MIPPTTIHRAILSDPIFYAWVSMLLIIPGASPATDASPSDGFVRVAEIDDAWWFIDPEGKPFFSTGINHGAASYLWLQPYNREATLERFGPELATIARNPKSDTAEQWLRYIESLMREWHFNSLGMHTVGVAPDLISQDIYYTAELRLMKYHTAMRPDDAWPDVFSRQFEQDVEAEATNVCGQNKDKPNLLGYYFTDEPAWTSYFRRLPEEYEWWFHLNPWVDALRRLPAVAPGKQAWIAVLKENHDLPAAAAELYGVTADTWKTLADRTDWSVPEPSEELTRDVEAMLTRIAERSYAVQHDAVRRHDPNHLIFGDKHRHTPPNWLLPILKKHVDVVVMQCYGPYEGYADHLREIHEATGKPILIGDGHSRYRGAQQTGLVDGVNIGKTYDEAKMGAIYHNELRNLASITHLLGFHHCGFIETYETPQRKGIAPRTGFIDPFGKPYEVFIERVSNANRQANEWHRASAKNN